MKFFDFVVLVGFLTLFSYIALRAFCPASPPILEKWDTVYTFTPDGPVKSVDLVGERSIKINDTTVSIPDRYEIKKIKRTSDYWVDVYCNKVKNEKSLYQRS